MKHRASLISAYPSNIPELDTAMAPSTISYRVSLKQLTVSHIFTNFSQSPALIPNEDRYQLYRSRNRFVLYAVYTKHCARARTSWPRRERLFPMAVIVGLN